LFPQQMATSNKNLNTWSRFLVKPQPILAEWLMIWLGGKLEMPFRHSPKI